MHLLDFQERVDSELRDAVTRHFPLDWKEDPISHDFLIRLRKGFKKAHLFSSRMRLHIEWEIYKLHGPAETNHGDIGILVRYKTPTEETLEGAGFVEAKVRGRNTTKFQQVRRSQITRIISRSPQARLLLYDYNPITVIDPTEVSAFDPDWFIYHGYRTNHARVTHGAVVPLQLAAAINQYDDTLYAFCHSFSYQLCSRYLQLHDLDFSGRAVNAVKGFPAKVSSPNVVMVIRVAPDGRDLPEPFTPNDNVYGPLE